MRQPRTCRPSWLLLLACFLATPLLADDIKLKSGEALTDVEIVEKKPDKWKVKTLDGKSRTINAADVAEHVEKPTAGQEFDGKAAGLKGKADIPKMLELAKWGLEKGAKIHATKMLNKVLSLNRDQVEAHELLGHELVAGKWLGGKDLETHKMKVEEERRKAEGYVKVDGEWVDLFTARCQKAGLTEHEGRWYAKDDLKKVMAGMVYSEGSWLPKDAKEKLEQGLRLESGKWINPKDQDAAHKDLAKNPWVVESEHFRFRGVLSHAALMKGLANAESVWPQLVATFKDGPLAMLPDKKLTMYIGAKLDDYRHLGGTLPGGDDRASLQSSNHAVFYSSTQRAVGTFYEDEGFYSDYIRHGAVLAYLGGFADYDKLKSPMLEGFASYFECTNTPKGEYVPHGAHVNILRGTLFGSPRKEFQDWQVTHRQNGFYKMGFLIHFFMTKYPEDMKLWIPKFLAGATYVDLVDPIEKRTKTDLAAEVNELFKAIMAVVDRK